MSCDDYRYNRLRRSIEEEQESWSLIRDRAIETGDDFTKFDANGRVAGLETALQLFDRWTLDVQAEVKQ